MSIWVWVKSSFVSTNPYQSIISIIGRYNINHPKTLGFLNFQSRFHNKSSFPAFCRSHLPDATTSATTSLKAKGACSTGLLASVMGLLDCWTGERGYDGGFTHETLDMDGTWWDYLKKPTRWYWDIGLLRWVLMEFYTGKATIDSGYRWCLWLCSLDFLRTATSSKHSRHPHKGRPRTLLEKAISWFQDQHFWCKICLEPGFKKNTTNEFRDFQWISIFHRLRRCFGQGVQDFQQTVVGQASVLRFQWSDNIGTILE